jgi:hypothetical protein
MATPYDCPDCGQTHPLGCRGHANVKDEDDRIVGKRPCRKAPLAGQTVCGTHGGFAQQNRRAGEQRTSRERAEKAFSVELKRLGSEHLPETDPLVGIMRAVNVAGFAVEYFRFRASELNEVYEDDHLGDKRPHVFVQLLREWTTELARASKAALEVGVKEQQLRIFSEQTQLLADLVRKVFDDPELGLTVEQRQAGIHVVARHLRAVDDAA